MAAPRTETMPGPIEARVVRVIDGDTILVRAKVWLGQEVETLVRLSGIDTPELHGRCPREKQMAEKARAFLVARLEQGEVRLRQVAFDKYGGRVLAKVETNDGEDLGTLLLRSGLGRAYGGTARSTWCN